MGQSTSLDSQRGGEIDKRSKGFQTDLRAVDPSA